MSEDTGIKVVITVSIIALACVAAVVIAKLVDRCYDKRVKADDDGDTNENIQQLIRARLSVVQYRKREIQKAKQNRVLKVFREWAGKVRHKKEDRESALKANKPPGTDDDVVITIDRAVSEKRQNGSPRTPRFPFFTGGSLAGGAQKTQGNTRKASHTNTETSISVSPVPKGRPVSSKTRVFPNVIVTSVDGNMSKVLPKPVVIEDDKNGAATVIKQNGIKT